MPTHQHFMLHKPYGYLSQFVSNEGRRRNKKKLGELYDFPDGTMAIGRLDEASEGLLLLTTDGQVSLDVRSKKVEKEYLALVDGIITEQAITELQSGVDITVKQETYTTLPCQAQALEDEEVRWTNSRHVRDERHGPTSWVSITLTEGKNRQVRKMTAAVGFPTLRLIRVRIGDIHLGQLAAGKVVTLDEIVVGS
ncbi:pseudouridine synthase [Reichenbachiella sp. MSK19-1]|uniref:pseudouridine synthase n=1 Tax=Reichenbachiella sp. MSK19-1 TaxID=1897631 RepID=UPI000E6D0816|nr:pseudouridine synthase [Reichenbachiella sp. MSK19-1]RJE72830.1 pseudouridine synthase [Reichenbachiella sp. MSK19-1]